MSLPSETDLRALVSAFTGDGTSLLPILELLLGSIADGVQITDETGRVVYLNAAARRILGVAPGSGVADLQAPVADLYYLHDFSPIPADERPLARALCGEESKDVEVYAKSAALPEGVLLCLNARPIRRVDGRVAGGIAVFHDVGERRRAEEELHAANAKLGAWVAELERRATASQLLNDMADLLQSCISTKEFYEVVSRFAGRIFAHEPGAMFIVNASRSAIEMVASWGISPAERIFAPDACWALRRGRMHRAGDATGPDCEHASSAGTAGYRCIPMMGQGEALGILHVQAHPDDLGPPSELATAAADSRCKTIISAAEHIALSLANLKLRETLRMQAIRDPLTGLFNRRYMEESLEREIVRARRSGGSVAAVMIDVDHFKRYNDTFGHAAADVALRETAATIKNSLRADDIACRFGGEEIVAILPEATGRDGATRAEAVRAAVAAQQVRYHGAALGTITASFGVACFPEHAESGEALLRAADEALYQAKAEGRNRVCIKGGAPAPDGPRPMPAHPLS